jgi:hypothetical protein
MSMNHRNAVAARNRQREALLSRVADNDQKPSKPVKHVTNVKSGRTRKKSVITLAPVSLIDDKE